MPRNWKIGMIGLDTSHVTAFTKLLNDPTQEYHVPGGKVVAAYPGIGSTDFSMSIDRLAGFTRELQEEYGVEILRSPEEVAERCDVILLESVDGRVHLEQFRRIAPFGKPVFVDKPLAVSSEEAGAIARLAATHGVAFMSCSAVRFAEGLAEAINRSENGDIIGADTFGPMDLQETQPGMFWYGIHSVDMLYHVLGKGCMEVQAVTNADHDLIVGEWADGRIGTVRGNRRGNRSFGGAIHRSGGTDFIDVYRHPKPYYASLLERVMQMFETGKPGIDPEETLEIIRFMEAANESRATGKRVKL